MFRWRLAVAAACVLLFGLGAKGDSARNDHRQNTKAFVSVAKDETVARGFLYSRWLDDGEGLYHHSTIAPQHKSESESANENSGAFSTRRFWRRVSDNARGAFGMLAPDAEDLRDEVVRFGNGEKITFGEWRKLRALNALDKFHAGVADAVADAAQKFLQDVSSVRRVEVDVQSPFAGRDGQVAVQAVGEFYAARRGVAGWQLRMFVAEGEAEGGNLGLFRRVEHAGMLWGANIFLDYQREAEGKFLRSSLGGEWRAGFGDIVFNNYWPLTDKKAIDGGGYAYSRRGFDARFRWHIPNLEWVSARGDYMHWRGRFGQEDEKEFLYGLEFRPGDWNIALRYGGGGKWGVDVNFSHELHSPPISSLRRFGRDFDAREHFWDSVRREYGQRISRYRGGGLSGGQGAVSAKDFQLTVYVTSPALTATISPIDGALVISQNVEPFARTVESFRLTLTGGMTLSTGASDSPTNSVVIRGVGANWLLGLQRETRAAFAPELAGIAASKGGGLFEREGARVLSLFAVAANDEVVTMRLVGTRFAFTSTTQAQVSLAEGALSVSLAGANTLTLTADINDGAALYVYGATIATVGCAESQLRELWNLRAHCALRGGVVDEGVVTIAARRAAVVGSVTLNTEGATAAVSPAEFALSTSGRTLIVSLTATSLEATMLAAVVSITDSVPLLFTMTVSVAPVLSVFVIPASVTLTAHVLATVSIGVVGSGGGGAAHRYSLLGGGGVSLNNARLSATLSVTAQQPLTITAAVYDDLNDSATITITQTITAINPPPLSMTIENAPAVVAVGVEVFAGSVFVSGGYGGYSLRALPVSGNPSASVTINADGALMARVLSAGSLSVTIIADDNHPNTEAATLTLTLRAVDMLALGASYNRATVTTHVPATAALLTLNAAGGGGGYVYSLLAGNAGLSLAGVALSGVFSLSSPLPLTATAQVTDTLSARASLIFTLTIEAVEPEPVALTVSANGAAVVVNEAVSVAIANAGGGYIVTGGRHTYGALVDSSAASASVSGGGVVSLMALRAGSVTMTITADDNHPTTEAATAFITLRAVDSLSLSIAPVSATLTTHIAGTAVFASLRAIGGGDSYNYSLAHQINGVSLSGRVISVTASLTAERVLTITAIAIDDLQHTATAALTTTINAADPPPLTASVLNVAPIVQSGLELTLTATAFGGYVGGGDYKFGITTDAARASAGISGVSVITMSVFVTGLVTATLTADDDHPNTPQATAFITMSAVNELALLPLRANATLTAHIAGAATLATLRAVGGLPPVAYTYNASDKLSIEASVILITLSSSSSSSAMSVYALTATVIDARPATAILALSLTLEIFSPPPVSLSVAVVNSVILTGALAEVVKISAVGGLLVGFPPPAPPGGRGEYRYSAFVESGADIIIAEDGRVFLSVANTSTITATLTADDEHPNTPQATAFITTRAIERLSMSVSLFGITMTTHIPGTAVFASVGGTGGGDSYNYSLANPAAGVSLSGRVISLTASLTASRVLTMSVVVNDNLQNTATISFTTTIHAQDPPPLTAYPLTNTSVIEISLTHTITASASGGLLIDFPPPAPPGGRGEYRFSAKADSARANIGVSGVSVITLSPLITGTFTATLTGDDDHPNTPQATAYITLLVVDKLKVEPQRTSATLTARINGEATLATLAPAGGWLQTPGGAYQYGLGGADELFLRDNFVVITLSSAAPSATTSVYVVTATITDDRPATTALTFSLTLQIYNPPPVSLSVAGVAPVVQVGAEQTLTAHASGGLLIDSTPPAEYRFGAAADSLRASIGISGVSVITMSALTTGALTATITADDDHPNTPQATAFITMSAVNELALLPERAEATLTAHIAGAATLATLRAVGGLPEFDYSFGGDDNLSLEVSLIVITLSSSAPSATMSVYALTATVIDARPATSALTFSVTLDIFSPPPVSLSAVVDGTVILTGALTEVASLSVAGGLLTGGADYSYNAFVKSGASISVSNEGVVSLSVANTSTITATITADDEHPNTPAATVFLTIRAIEQLSASVSLFDITMTTHIAGTAVFASLNGIGGGGIYNYSLAHQINGVSMSGRAISLTASLTASRALTITAIVNDDLTNTTTLTFTTTIHAQDPPPITASVLGAAAIVQAGLELTMTATASGGWLRGDDYAYGITTNAAKANIGISGVSVITLEALTTGTLTATLTADDDHPNTEQATAFITMNAVNELSPLPSRANATLTAHLAGTATLATLHAIGGLPPFAYSYNATGKLSIDASVILITMSSSAPSATMSVYVLTATVSDARPATAIVTFSLTLQIHTPPPVMLSVRIVNSVILTGKLTEVATVSAAGGYLATRGSGNPGYAYGAMAGSGVRAVVSGDGNIWLSVANISRVTATILVGDDHPNTPQATVFITTRAIDALSMSVSLFDITMTTHIAGTAVFASVSGIGGGDTYNYSLINPGAGVALNGQVMSLTASLLASRGITASVVISDNLQNTATIAFTTTVHAKDPPPLTAFALTNTAVIEISMTHTITASASGGLLIDSPPAGEYRFGAQADNARANIGISGVSVITLSPLTTGTLTATLTADDDHPNTPQAAAYITLLAVGGLQVEAQRTSATLTARIAGEATLATLLAANGWLRPDEGNNAGYQYGLNGADELFLRDDFVVVTLSSAAPSATMSVYVVTATITDDRPATTALTFSLTLQIYSPPQVSVSVFVNTAVIETSLEIAITASASGGYLRDGNYQFGAAADSAKASIGISGVSVITLSALATGTLTATITADDNHPNTEQATAIITLTAVNKMSIIPQRTRATLTAHIAGAATLVTLNVAGGLPPHSYSFGGDDNLSLQVSLIVITLSSSAPSATMSVYAITATATDARPITSALTFSVTLEIYSPPQITLSAAVDETVILTGALTEVASLSVGGGLLTGGADYSYNAFVKSGASVSVSNEGVVSLSAANTSTITATITADDEHANTPAATVFITIRAIEQLKLSAEVFDTTMTTHIAGTAVFASLHRIGGGDTFTYSLTHKPEGASLSGRAISLTASLTASRAMTISAIVGDNLQNTATIAFTTTVQAIDPSQVSVSVFVNTAVIETSLQITITASASGGYLRDGNYQFGAAADSAKASIGISGVSVITLSALATGTLTATITADDNHPNTEQATAIITLTAVNKMSLTPQRTRATLTAHIAGAATLAILNAAGGLPPFAYSFGGDDNLSLQVSLIVITLSSSAPSATMSVYAITATATDARPITSALTFSATLEIYSPPQITLSAAVDETVILTGALTEVASLSVAGGLLTGGADYSYNAFVKSGASIGVSNEGVVSLSVANTSTVTATITADDEHANTPAATVFITIRAIEQLKLSAEVFDTTMTTHIAGTAVFASLHRIGGGDTFTYSLTHKPEGASLSGRAISLTASLTASRAMTISAIVGDNLQNTATIAFTTTVQAIDPSQVSVSVFVNTAVIETSLQITLTASASGGYLFPTPALPGGKGEYEFGVAADSARASVGISGVSVVTLSALVTGSLTATITADDDHPNTEQATALVTLNAVDKLLVLFDRAAQATMTAHIAGTATLATLDASGGLNRGGVGFGGEYAGLTLAEDGGMVITLSSTSPSATLSVFVITASVLDARPATATLEITLTMQIINPPPLSISVNLGDTLMLAGRTYDIATVTGQGGYLLAGSDYVYGITTNEDVAKAGVSPAGIASVSVHFTTAGVITATITADDDHPNTPAATIFITAKAFSALLVSAVESANTITNHLPSVTLTMATLHSQGGAGGYTYSLQATTNGATIDASVVLMTISINYDAPTLAPELTITAIVADASLFVASVTATFSVQAIDPPPISMSRESGEFAVFGAQAATVFDLSVSVGGGWLRDGEVYYDLSIGAIVSMTIADNGTLTSHARTVGTFLITVFAEDHNPNTPRASLILTADVQQTLTAVALSAYYATAITQTPEHYRITVRADYPLRDIGNPPHAPNIVQNTEDAGGGALAKITLGAFGPTITRLSVSSPGNMVRHFTNEDGYPVTATINNSDEQTGAFIVDLDNAGVSSDIAFALLRLRNATAAANMTATMIFTDDTARTVFLPTTLVVEVTAINRLSVSAALPGSVYVSDVGVTVPVASITAWTDDFPVTLSMLSVTPAEFKLSNSVVYYELQVELQTVTVSIFARDSYAFAHGDFNVPPQTLRYEFTMTAQGRMVAGVMDNIATVFNPRYEGRAAIITARGGVLSEGGAYQFSLMQESEGAFFLNASTTLATMMFNAENEKLYMVTIVVNDYSDPQDELFITMSVWSAKCGFSLGVGCAPLNYDGKMSAEILTAQLAREIITAGANVNARDAGVALRPPPLLRAVHEHAQIPVMSILLTAGANPRGVDEEARTALHYAANRGLPMMTLLLSAAPVLVSARDAEEYMPLHYVAMSGAVLEAMMLLNNGAVRSWPSADETARFGLPFGATPFDAADKGGDLDMINYLRFVDAICLARCRVGDVDAFGVTVMPFNINTGGATLRADTEDAAIVTMTVRGGAYTRTRAPFMTLFGGGNFTLAGAGAERTLIHGGMIAEGEYYPVFGVDDNSPYTPFTNITITVKAEVPPPFAAGFDDGISVIRAGHSATVATITANWGIDAVEIVAAQSDAQFTLESMSVIRYRNTNAATATGVFKVVSSADREFGQVTVTISITVGAIDTCRLINPAGPGNASCGDLINQPRVNEAHPPDDETARKIMRAGVDLPEFPAAYAGFYNSEKMLRAMLEFGIDANVESTNAHDGGVALHWAAHFANLAAITALLDAGANINFPSQNIPGRTEAATPLDLAIARSPYINLAQSQAAQSLLVSRGAYCYQECNNANIITGVEGKPQGGLLTAPEQRVFRYGITGTVGVLGAWDNSYIYSQTWTPANLSIASILITNSVIQYYPYDTEQEADTTLTVVIRKLNPSIAPYLSLTIINTHDCRFDLLDANPGRFACLALGYKGMNNGAGAQIPNLYLALSLVRANAEFTDELGDSVWRAAAQNNALDLARVLLRETNHRAARYVWNSPFNELNDSQTEMFRLLISAGADVNGTTEIHPVLGFAHNNALSLTVGSTPLDIANLNNRTAIAALLKQNGARCNLNCADGDLHISPLASRIINEQRIVRANVTVTVGVVEPLARISYQLSLSFGKPDFSLDGSRVLLMTPQPGANTARVVVREQSNDSASFTLGMTITSVLPCDMGVSAARSDSFYRAAGCPALNHTVISESEPARALAEQLARAGAANYASGGTIYNAWNDVIETNSRALALVMAEQRFSPDDYALIPPIAAVFLQDYEADFMLDQLLRAGANVNLTTRAQRAVVGRNHAVGSTPLDIVNVQYTDLDKRNRYRAILKSRGARCNTFCLPGGGDIALNVVPEGEVVVYDSISVVRAGHNATIARFAAAGVTIAARALSVYPPNAPVSLSVSDMLLARMLVSNAPVAGDVTAVYEVLRTPDAGRGMAALTTRFSLTIRAVSQCQFRGAGCPALHHNGVITDAAPNGELAKALIRAGANAGSGANNIWFAAVTATNTHLARELHLHAVNPNHKTTESATPLHFAAYQRNSLMIYYLANTGADLRATLTTNIAAFGAHSQAGNTPLDMIRLNGEPEEGGDYLGSQQAIRLHGGPCNLVCRVGDRNYGGMLLVTPSGGFDFTANVFLTGHHGTIGVVTAFYEPVTMSVVRGAELGFSVEGGTMARFQSNINNLTATGVFALTSTSPTALYAHPFSMTVMVTTTDQCAFLRGECPLLGYYNGSAGNADRYGDIRALFRNAVYAPGVLARKIVRSGAPGLVGWRDPTNNVTVTIHVWTEVAAKGLYPIAEAFVEENFHDTPTTVGRLVYPLMQAVRIGTPGRAQTPELAEYMLDVAGADAKGTVSVQFNFDNLRLPVGATPLDVVNAGRADLSETHYRQLRTLLISRDGRCNIRCNIGDKNLQGKFGGGPVKADISHRFHNAFRNGFNGTVAIATAAVPGEVTATMIIPNDNFSVGYDRAGDDSVIRFKHIGNIDGNHQIYTLVFDISVVHAATAYEPQRFEAHVRVMKNCSFQGGCSSLPNHNYTGPVGNTNPGAELASVLLRSGADINTNLGHVWMDVGYSGYFGTPNIELATVLANFGVFSDSEFGNRGTPLIYAAALGNVTVVSAMVSAGANINQTAAGTAKPFSIADDNFTGYTPLDAANARGEPDANYTGANKPAVRAFLKATGAKCRLNCREGDTHLDGGVVSFFNAGFDLTTRAAVIGYTATVGIVTSTLGQITTYSDRVAASVSAMTIAQFVAAGNTRTEVVKYYASRLSGNVRYLSPLTITMRVIRQSECSAFGRNVSHNGCAALDYAPPAVLTSDIPSAITASMLLRAGAAETFAVPIPNTTPPVVFSGHLWHDAARYGNLGLATALLNLRPAAITIRDFDGGLQPIHDLARSERAVAGKPAMLTIMLNAGANVNATSSKDIARGGNVLLAAGATPLDIWNLVMGGENNFRTVLLDNGARCNIACGAGDTNLQGVQYESFQAGFDLTTDAAVVGHTSTVGIVTSTLANISLFAVGTNPAVTVSDMTVARFAAGSPQRLTAGYVATRLLNNVRYVATLSTEIKVVPRSQCSMFHLGNAANYSGCAALGYNDPMNATNPDATQASMLLRAGATEVLVFRGDQWHIWHLAARHGNLGLMTVLSQHRAASVTAVQTDDSYEPMHELAAYAYSHPPANAAAALTLMLSAGANINAETTGEGMPIIRGSRTTTPIGATPLDLWNIINPGTETNAFRAALIANDARCSVRCRAADLGINAGVRGGARIANPHTAFRTGFEGVIGTVTSAFPGSITVSLANPPADIEWSYNGTAVMFKHTAAIAANAHNDYTLTFNFNLTNADAAPTVYARETRVITVRALGRCNFVVGEGCRLPGFQYEGGTRVNQLAVSSLSVLLRSGVDYGNNRNYIWFQLIEDAIGQSSANIPLAQAIASLGVNPNVRDERRPTSPSPNANLGTPLVFASYYGMDEYVSLLIGAGANVNMTTTAPAYFILPSQETIPAGYTPLDAANAGPGINNPTPNKAEVISILKANGALCQLNCQAGDTNIAVPNGIAGLHTAFRTGFNGIIGTITTSVAALSATLHIDSGGGGDSLYSFRA